MRFKVGQHVVVKRSLGRYSGEGRGSYYYGCSVRDVPLGSKGLIVDNSESFYVVRIKNREYSLTRGEIASDVEANAREQAKKDSELEDVLVGEEVSAPVQQTDSRTKPFEPKFNAREEFVVWLNEQFPGLPSEQIQKRRKEVYEAAIQACEHGIKTTRSCVHEYFNEIKYGLKSGSNWDFYEAVRRLTSLSKQVSANLIDKSHRHYGTALRRAS